MNQFIESLYEYLTLKKCPKGTIVRRHSKKLDESGDLSFPLFIKNWTKIVDKTDDTKVTIFDYTLPGVSLGKQIDLLVETSGNWTLSIEKCQVKNDDVLLFLQRSSTVATCLKQVLAQGANYGFMEKHFKSSINVVSKEEFESSSNLTQLKLIIVKNVANQILHSLTRDVSKTDCDIEISTNSNLKERKILVGSVLNDSGNKDVKTTAGDLYQKRALDMQLMAQHKYGIQVKPLWSHYFETLGKASVTIEMLQNKIHKASKISLNSPQTTNKGPAFIFYNCARISSLLKQFENKIAHNVYPDTPDINSIDFALLNQSEEWQLVYTFILQFPSVVLGCVSDVRLGVLNVHNLVFFLSNLSSVFSVYYRRVKILINGKEHLLPSLYARIYLIRALQRVFHTGLHLLDIEPVTEM